MSIGLTYTEEKKSDSSAKHANNERGHSMPGRIAGQSSKLSTLLVGVEASVPTAAGELGVRPVGCDSPKARPPALFFSLRGAEAGGDAFFRGAVWRGAVAPASGDAAPAPPPATR